MIIMLRRKALVAILVILLLTPSVVGHGANSYTFIMRNQSIQPSEAQVLDNSTIIFYNVASDERTILIDKNRNGADGVQCVAEPFNSSSNSDECRIWLEPGGWEEGIYEVSIISNGTIWNTLSLTISLDNHTEISGFDLAGPSGYSFNEKEVETSEDTNVYEIGILALILIGAFWPKGRSNENE